jgi:hypothetical protein
VKGVRRPATPIGPAKGVLRPATPIAPAKGVLRPGNAANTAGNPGPSTPSAPPPDPTYEAYRASAGRNISVGNAEAAYQHANISNEYGIGDSSNPFSRAAMLQESYNRSKLGTTNSLAAQGQLYSGAMINAQNENQHQYSIQNDALQRAYGAAQRSVTLGQAQNYANNAIGVSDQGFAALLRSLGMG